MNRADTILDVELDPLFPWQAEFMGVDPMTGLPLPKASLLPWRFASCGTKSGKTHGTAIGLASRFLNEQISCLWTAPLNRQLEPTWRRYLRPIFKQLPRTMVKISDSWGMWKAELVGTDAAFSLLSGEDPDSLRGSSYGYAAIDEAARYPKDSYDSVLTNLTDTNGILFAISTPRRAGKRQGQTWFTQEYLEGKRQAALGVRRTNQSWQIPTNANPLPAVQARFALMKEKFGEDSPFFREEYLAEILDSDGSVFRRIGALHRSERTPYQEGHTYCYGWDPALTRDASVLSIWDVAERREVHLERLPMNDWTAQLARLTFLVNAYHCSRGRFDASSLGGQVTLDQLRQRGIPGEPVSFNQHTKPEVIQALSLAMEAEEPRFLDDELARAEMEHYTYTVLPSGIVRYHPADGYHDDHVSARVLAWWDLTRGKLQIFFDEPEERAASPEVAEQTAGWQAGEDVESLLKRTGAWAGSTIS